MPIRGVLGRLKYKDNCKILGLGHRQHSGNTVWIASC